MSTFVFPAPEEGLNRHLEFVAPDGAIIYEEMTEDDPPQMAVWCDAPGEALAPSIITQAMIRIRIVDGKVLIESLEQG